MKKLTYNTKKSEKIWTDYYSRNDLQTKFIRFLDNNYFSHAFYHSLKEILPKEGKILEAGCGEGIISARLLKKGHNVTFMDISKQALLQAKQNVNKVNIGTKKKKVQYVQGNIFAPPFKKNQFDVVWNQGVLEHFTEPEKAIAKLYHITNVGGTVAILVPFEFSPLHLYDVFLKKIGMEKLWPFEEQIFYSKKLLKKQLAHATGEKPIVKIIPFALGFSIMGYVKKENKISFGHSGNGL